MSAFRFGFNILFDEETDPGFVSVQTEDVPLHPWALEISAIPRGIEDGLPVRAEAGRILLGSVVPHTPQATSVMPPLATIHWQQATRHELRIRPYTEDEAKRALARLPLLEQILGEERAKRESDPFQSQIDETLERWKEAGGPEVLQDLIGLGSGSTPSGDDVLVGMLAGLTAFEEVSDKAKARLASLCRGLHNVETQRTHPASAQMIAAAVDGAFPGLLGDLVAQSGVADATGIGIRQCVERVANQGETSGSCFLLGFMAAQQATQHQE